MNKNMFIKMSNLLKNSLGRAFGIAWGSRPDADTKPMDNFSSSMNSAEKDTGIHNSQDGAQEEFDLFEFFSSGHPY